MVVLVRCPGGDDGGKDDPRAAGRVDNVEGTRMTTEPVPAAPPPVPAPDDESDEIFIGADVEGHITRPTAR